MLQVTVTPTRNRKWLIALSFSLVVGMFLFVLLDELDTPPDIAILPLAPFTMKDGRVPDRWIPSKWS
jgi:hypothetical protein